MKSNSKQAVEARREARVGALKAELERLVELLRARPEVIRVVLFGSLAAGHVGARSDLDLAVVDEGLKGGELSGVPVVGPEDVSRLEWDAILVTALDDLDAVDDQMEKLGLPESKVWRLK